jgi:nicotinamide-nucleotide amidase
LRVTAAQDVASVQRLLDVLRQGQQTLAVAEGDTGGLVLEWLTSVPGSSAVVLGGVVAYHDALKQRLLGVSRAQLIEHGAVSQAVAEAMVEGVRDATGADFGLAATGIAGPGGATLTKPVGLAWVAVGDARSTRSRQHHWSGDRGHNRAASARALVELTLEFLR